MSDDWITTTEAARISQYSIVHVRRLAKTGDIVAQKWGRDWMIDRKSLSDYLEKIEAKGDKRGPTSQQ